MKEILISLFSLVFLIISAFHFYWALGGTYGSKVVLPQKLQGELAFKPNRIMTGFVAFVFLFISLFPLIQNKWLQIYLPEFILKYGYWALLVLLVLRSIGDFKFVGLFKKIKNTAFSKYDSKFFTPLCIVLSIIISILLLKS